MGYVSNVFINSFFVSFSVNGCIHAYSQNESVFGVFYMTCALINLAALLVNILAIHREES